MENNNTKLKYRKKVIEKLNVIAPEIYSEDEFHELDRFIFNYDQDSFEKIKFDWNGKHAANFDDSNHKFRQKVSFYLLARYENVENSMLLKDLFCEQSKCDKETWSVSSYLFLIGERLLLADHKEYIFEFLESAMRTMDTYLNCIQIQLCKEIIDAIIDEINLLREVAQDDHVAIKLLDNGLSYVKNFEIVL